jgi:hypothetical protein
VLPGTAHLADDRIVLACGRWRATGLDTMEDRLAGSRT